MIERVKNTSAPVFILGESGTGKELVARTVHESGQRKHREFVAVNCSAIPDHLLESEFFGHLRGAFTGATRDKPGLVEEADGGTFFLDEIADLSPPLQAKLLRLLQEKEFRRVGDNRVRHVDVRFISATNKNIEQEVRSGRFREDLYYRLKIITIEIPPLRDRKEDILFLINCFLDKYSQEMSLGRSYFSPQCLELLVNYSWPGNVRELQNEIQRCLILCGDDDLIREEHLSPRINPDGKSHSPVSDNYFHAKAEFEKRFLNQALERFRYNRAKTAEKVGLSRQGLFKLIKKHNITVPSERGKIQGG
jgi:transcriptional regulator with PAS, ATPase and Fis domain